MQGVVEKANTRFMLPKKKRKKKGKLRANLVNKGIITIKSPFAPCFSDVFK